MGFNMIQQYPQFRKPPNVFQFFLTVLLVLLRVCVKQNSAPQPQSFSCLDLSWGSTHLAKNFQLFFTVLHLFKTVCQFVLITTEVVISSANLRQVLQSSEAASKHLDKLAEERRMQIDRGVEMGTVAAAVASSGFGQSTISYSNGASFFPVELHIGGIPIFGQTRKNGTLLCSASYEEVLNHRTNVPSRQGRQTFGKRGNTRLGLVCLVAHSLVSIP